MVTLKYIIVEENKKDVFVCNIENMTEYESDRILTSLLNNGYNAYFCSSYDIMPSKPII